MSDVTALVLTISEDLTTRAFALLSELFSA